MTLTKDQIKVIATNSQDNTPLFDAVHKYSHSINVSLKQAYLSILVTVQVEYPKYKPYSGYESFKVAYYRRSK